MRVVASLALLAACGGAPPQPPVANTTTPAAGSAAPAPPAVADDCEPPSTSDTTRFGVHAIEVPGGPQPYRWADANNKILATPYLFDNGPDYWQEGFARIVDGTGKMGFIDEHGTIVVPPTYDWVYPFCHGIAKTARGGTPGYIDRSGKPTTGPADDPRPLVPEPDAD